MKVLIVNADDFGYSSGINQGIIRAYVDGIVTATSVMVDAVAAKEAVQLTNYPNLAVGLHFVPDPELSVEAALNAQIESFTSIYGSKPTHIDVHKIQKDDLQLKDKVLQYASEHDLPARYSGAAKFIDSFFGPHANGDVSVAQLKRAMDEATDDVNEIMCHVGYADDYILTHSSYNVLREKELETICSPEIKDYLSKKDLQLSNWALL